MFAFGKQDIGESILNVGGNIEARFEAHCALPEGREVSDELPFPEPPVTAKLMRARLKALERRGK